MISSLSLSLFLSPSLSLSLSLPLSLRYATARSQPPIDDSQDIDVISATNRNGITTITFRRPRTSNNEFDISLNECRYFLFGWGGEADVETREISYHPSTPIVSQERICLPMPANCPDGGCGLIISRCGFLL